MSGVRDILKETKRIVVKVGTSTLTYDTGKANFSRIDKLTRVLSDLANQGKEVILVTSGAIGIGVGKLNLKEKPKAIREKQAVAAVGQCELMHIYSKFFSEYGHIVGQILLTRDVVGDDICRANVINTFESLLEKGIIPIVNENDSVSVAEIKIGQKDTFSENDTLAAMVSKLTKADLLIILSDVDGFYDSDPKTNTNAKKFSVVDAITPEVEKCAGGAGTTRGTGGAVTRIKAAKTATSAGVNMVLTNGEDPSVILDIINGEDIGTLFLGQKRSGKNE
jgi:glutamate 5-kinase